MKDPKDVNDMNLEEMVLAYCESAAVKNKAEALISQLRPSTIQGMDAQGIKKFEGDGFSLEKRITVRKKVNMEELEKVSHKKGISIGNEVLIIRPKGSNIPEKVLKELDKYFVLERSREVDTKDVQKALDNGFITAKDYGKIIEESEVIALYPYLSDERKEAFGA